MSSNHQCWWSPHSTADQQRFVKINSREQELAVYDVVGSSVRFFLVEDGKRLTEARSRPAVA